MNFREYPRDAHDISKMQPSYHGALTVDLEDWKNALNPKPNMKHAEIDVSYMRESTKRILHILEECETKATFFVLGEVALAAPETVKEISRRGHEIGSHSPSHVPPRNIPRDKYRSLVKRDVELLGRITGQDIRGFRAPYFAISRNEGWLLKMLAEIGFVYDSSVVPSWTPLYGIPNAPKYPYYPDLNDISKQTPGGSILELPVSVWPSWSTLPGLPVGGGFFMRLWPSKLYLQALRRNIRSGHPLNLYIHLADLDQDKMTGDGLALSDRVIQYVGIKKGMRNFSQLLGTVRLGTISEVFSQQIEAVRNQTSKQSPRF